MVSPILYQNIVLPEVQACSQAIRSNNLEEVQRNLNMITAHVKNPLTLAAEHQSWAVLAHLLEHTTLDEDDIDSAFHLIVEHKYIEGMRLFIDQDILQFGPVFDQGDRAVIQSILVYAPGLTPTAIELAILEYDVPLLRDIIGENRVFLNNLCIHDADCEDNLTPLCCAVKEGKLEHVCALVELGADLNSGTEYQEETPLMLAALMGHVDIARYLIDQGADVNLQDVERQTPLAYAASEDHIDIARLFIQKGACLTGIPINEDRSVSVPTPLMLAAQQGHIAVMRLLIEADLSLLNIMVEDTGMNALNYSIQYRSLERAKAMCRLLIEKGAEVNQSTFVLAAQLDYTEMLDMFSEKLEGNPDRDHILVAVVKAGIECKCERIVHWALDKGLPVDYEDERGNTLLIDGAKSGFEPAIKALICLGADINQQSDVDGETPLIAAVQAGQLQAAQLLVKYNADIELAGMNGQTPLLCSIDSGKRDIFNWLISIGASLDQKTVVQKTALHIACSRGDLMAVEKILQVRPGQIKALASYGQTPLMLASCRTVVDALLEAGADPACLNEDGESALHYAANQASLNEIHSLEVLQCLMKVSDINAKSHSGETPLMIAAQEEWVEGVSALIGAESIDLNFQNIDGRTALAVCCFVTHETETSHSKKSIEVMEMLLEAGANCNLKSHQGRTPLMEAAEAKDSTVVQLLLRYGASIDNIDKEGCSALRIALKYGNIDAAFTLIEAGADTVGHDFKLLCKASLERLFNRIKEGDGEKVQRLLPLVIAQNLCADRTGQNALHVAAKSGQQRIACFLVSQQPGLLWEKNILEMDPIYTALDAGHLGLAEELIAVSGKPFDVNYPIVATEGTEIPGEGMPQETLLHRVCRFGKADVVHWILGHGADTLVRYNAEPVIFAGIESEDPGICQQLILHGAQVASVVDINKQTPWDRVQSSNNIALKKCIAAYFPEVLILSFEEDEMQMFPDMRRAGTPPPKRRRVKMPGRPGSLWNESV